MEKKNVTISKHIGTAFSVSFVCLFAYLFASLLAFFFFSFCINTKIERSHIFAWLVCCPCRTHKCVLSAHLSAAFTPQEHFHNLIPVLNKEIIQNEHSPCKMVEELTFLWQSCVCYTFIFDELPHGDTVSQADRQAVRQAGRQKSSQLITYSLFSTV